LLLVEVLEKLLAAKICSTFVAAAGLVTRTDWPRDSTFSLKGTTFPSSRLVLLEQAAKLNPTTISRLSWSWYFVGDK
jgi:hypothetical protein